jgi:hypothetical protein
MSAHVFKFEEGWDIPWHQRAGDVDGVLARGRFLPECWKGVYREAERLTPSESPEETTAQGCGPKVRGFLPSP